MGAALLAVVASLWLCSCHAFSILPARVSPGAQAARSTASACQLGAPSRGLRGGWNVGSAGAVRRSWARGAAMQMQGGGGAMEAAIERVLECLGRAKPGLGQNFYEDTVRVTSRSVARQPEARAAGVDRLAEMLAAELEFRLVDEQGVLEVADYQRFEDCVRDAEGSSMDRFGGFDDGFGGGRGGGGGGGMGGGGGKAEDLGQALESFSSKLDAYVRSRGLDGEEVVELKAIVTMAGRSLERRVKGGVVPAAGVREELEDALYAQIVEREGLLSVEDWGELTDGAAEQAAPPSMSPSAIMFELKSMYPQVPMGVLMNTAQESRSLVEAIAKLSAPVNSGLAPQRPAPARRGRLAQESVQRAEADLVGQQSLRTRTVNSGSAAYGLFFDLKAKERTVVVTGILTGASAGLAMGETMPLKVTFWMRRGGGARFEVDESAWEMLGEDDALTLPVVTWMETNPQYGALPMAEPIRIEKGETVGFCVRTSNVAGIATRMQPGRAIDTDMLDEDFGGKDSDDDVPGVLRKTYRPGYTSYEDEFLAIICGYTAVTPDFRRLEGAIPVPAAFVGEIQYEIE